MGKIVNFMVQNYGSLKSIDMGGIDNKALGNMVAMIGSSGSGKSTIADAFGFISDCIFTDLETALNMNNRGGFDRLVTQGNNFISFIIGYESDNVDSIIYSFLIERNAKNQMYIHLETLNAITLLSNNGQFKMELRQGKGYALSAKVDKDGKSYEVSRNPIELSDSQRLGIATLGVMKEYPVINEFLEFIKSWYLCYFTPDAARRIQAAAPSPYLNRTGDNLNNVARYMYRENPAEFQKILSDIQAKIPDITKIEPVEMINGQMELAFYQKGFEKPFFSQRMSDGTLKLFAYYLMLHEKNPRQLVFIEEPENGLYHHYLTDLALEMKRSAGSGYNKQIFVTTHSPFFVDALSPDQVWVLDKDKDGFTTAKRASEYPFVRELSEEGVSMGDLWYSKYFG